MTPKFWISASLLLLAAVAAYVWIGPVPQDPAYHRFADTRSWLGVPNAGDVLSNLALVLAGTAGAGWLLTGAGRRSCRTRTEHRAYLLFFTGFLLTGFGSGWYHLAPDNARLAWDRLPMTIAFMGLLSGVVAERWSEERAHGLMWPLVLCGIASVGYWIWTEGQRRGDLRPYGLVQFGSLAAVAAILLRCRSPYTHAAGFGWGALAYLAAKTAEALDAEIFSATGGAVSGHTLKHLAAAGAAAAILLMLARRRPSSLHPG
jgi:hypothetical protein